MKNISKFINDKTRHRLFESEGDELTSANQYYLNAASFFFVGAAREMAKDGLERRWIATLLMQAAADVLQDTPYDDVGDDLLNIAQQSLSEPVSEDAG